MNKRGGFIEGNLLKIILAVMILGLVLIPLAVKAYNLFGTPSDSKQAENNVKKISEISNSLVDGEEVEYLILSPEDWALTGWPVDDKKPKTCVNGGWENCLCMCHLSEAWFEKYSLSFYNFRTTSEITSEQYLDACDSESFCREVSYDELLVNPFNVPLVGEYSTPILVNSLVDSKQTLFLRREGNKLVIEVR